MRFLNLEIKDYSAIISDTESFNWNTIQIINLCEKSLEMIPHEPIVQGRPQSTKEEAEEEKDEEDEAG